LIINTLFISAQIDTLKGKVIDCETKEALINVDIMIKVISKNEYIGALTDIDGNFELYYKKENQKKDTIKISYLGYYDEIYVIEYNKKNINKNIEICLREREDWLREPPFKEPKLSNIKPIYSSKKTKKWKKNSKTFTYPKY